ncbi:tape measure protein [Azotobacter beijerinckii]|uniref:Tape measure domain-containing protein n=1 Tax=Azotobacter beijerinckii TaxID=170623 RepID=A0A1I4G195_9GAMM|nr:tape measure protein [Azotobacter beijerinckii]SFL23794.1 tape measure domain-containing protein [Azotobacter beijerinckii]
MAGIKERLIQFVLRGRDELSPAAARSTAALEALRQKSERLGAALDQAKSARALAASLAEAGRAADQARSGLQRAEQRATDLRAALDRDPESKGLAVALQEAEREAARANRELNRATAQLGELERAAKAAGIDTDNLADEQRRLSQAVDAGRQALAENAQQLRELERRQAAAARGAAEHASRIAAVREALDGATRRVLAFAGAFVGIDAAVSVFGRLSGAIRTGIVDMLKTGDQMEGLEIRVNSLMGSVELGEKAVSWIKDFTKTAPMTIADVTDAFALLKGFGLDPMDGSLQSLVDKNAQLGGEMDRLKGIIIALGQAWGKEKLQAEEIVQLVERGIPAWQLLAQTTGKTVAQLQELSVEGRIGRDVIAALIAEMGKSAEGSALAGMSRLNGLLIQLTATGQKFYSKIADAGALDYVKGRLQALLDTLGEMDRDGRLDKLAQSLSTAFVDGAKRVEEFGRKLLGTDFGKLADDSSRWARAFGSAIDDMTMRVKLFVAPFRTLFNGLTTSVSLVAGSLLEPVRAVVDAFALVSKAVPDMLGGQQLRSAVASAQDLLGSLSKGFLDQIKQDVNDAADAWGIVTDDLTARTKAAVAEQGSAATEAEIAWKKMADAGIVSNDAMRDAIVQAALAGTDAIDSLAEALELIDTARTVAQLEGLKTALFDAWQKGRLGLEDYQTAHNAVAKQIESLGQSAASAAGGVDENAAAIAKLKQRQSELFEEYRAGKVSLEAYQTEHNKAAEEIARLSSGVEKAAVVVHSYDEALAALSTAKTVAEFKALQKAMFEAQQRNELTMEQFQKGHNAAATAIRALGGAAKQSSNNFKTLDDELGNLAKVQQAIADAKTDVDFNKIRAALKKLYEDGAIGAEQYNKELTATNEAQRDLKGSIDKTAEEGVKAGEQLTKSQQMYNEAMEDGIVTSEELRRISGQRMEEERQGADEAQRDMSAWSDFYGKTLSNAREPLAAMSEAALEAFDRMRGVSSVDMSIDTSNLEATQDSLQRMTQSLADWEKAANGVGMSSLGKWQTRTMVDSQRVQVQFLAQKAALQSLMEGYENGSLSVADFVREAERARRGMSLLDRADLSSLENTLKSARQQMQALGDSSRDTLDSLQSELAQLRGDQEEVDRRAFDSRRRALEAQLTEARAAGNGQAVSDLNSALSTLGRIEAETAAQRMRAQQQAKAQQAGEAAPTPAPQQQPATVVRLEGPRGRRVDVQIPPGQQTQLLDILADAGLRTL